MGRSAVAGTFSASLVKPAVVTNRRELIRVATSQSFLQLCLMETARCFTKSRDRHLLDGASSRGRPRSILIMRMVRFNSSAEFVRQPRLRITLPRDRSDSTLD